MKINQIEQHYLKYYESIDFERYGLFQCARDNFGERNVAYLGSAAHVTPSFVFPNVTYVDNNSTVRDFFRDVSSVKEFIEKRKMYKHNVNISFLDVDYVHGKIQQKYDFVIAIFSPGSFAAAQKLLKENSILLYLPLPSERNIHKNDCSLKTIGSIYMSKGKYRLSQNTIENTYSKKDMMENKFHDVYAYSLWQRQ